MKCREYQPRNGGKNKGHRLNASDLAKRKVTHAEFMVWQAEKVGWPALAASFRQDLHAAQVAVNQLENPTA